MYYILQMLNMSQSNANTTTTTTKQSDFQRISREMGGVVNDNNKLLEMMKQFFQNDHRLFINFLQSVLDNKIQCVILPKILNIDFFRMMIGPSLFGTIFIDIFCTFINTYISKQGQSPAFMCIQLELLKFRTELGKNMICLELSQTYIRSTIHQIRGYDSDDEDDQIRGYDSDD